jgi:hypothetical protein
MRQKSTGRLILAIILVLLACIRFEYRTPEWEVRLPGLQLGVLILAIVTVVLLYRIFHSTQQECLERGLIDAPVKSQYNILIPLTLVAVAIKGVWYGDRIESMDGDEVYQWEIAWSDPTYDVPFFAGVVVLVLILRIRALFKAIEDHAVR